MTRITIAKRHLLTLLFAATVAVVSTPALAHHGWSWAEEKKSELSGTIEKISVAPPHPVLQVKSKDGVMWQIDLGNPTQTQRSGFTADTAKVGDAITVLGNRALDKSEMHMKAVRITLGGKNYDMYPERLTAN